MAPRFLRGRRRYRAKILAVVAILGFLVLLLLRGLVLLWHWWIGSAQPERGPRTGSARWPRPAAVPTPLARTPQKPRTPSSASPFVAPMPRCLPAAICGAWEGSPG